MNTETLKQMRAALIRNKAYQNALHTGLLAAGAGAAFRGGTGLANMLQRNLKPAARPSATAPQFIEVPIFSKKEKEKEELKKVAAGGLLSDVLSGAGNSNPGSWWGAYPLSVGAGAAGAYGGWKLTDVLLDRRRKAQVKSELEKAKKEYEEALAGRSKLGQQLDELYDNLEKQANTADYVGPPLGIAALYALLAGGGAGVAAYNFTKKRNPAKIKEKAKAQYRAERFNRRPPPILARPVPVEVQDESEELDTAGAGIEPLSDKQASQGTYTAIEIIKMASGK
jgi:hypothetical protein